LDINETLEKYTYKDISTEDNLSRRVFYTLTQDENLSEKRSTLLLSHLVELLYDRKVITEKDIDDMLLRVVF
jgi:hypothetical protein